MSATVIDQLIVKLGLDPKDFTKGEKAAAAAVADFQKTTEKSTQAAGGSITKLAARWLTVAAAIAAVKKVVSVIDDAAERTRRLGIDAKNYDIAAGKLRNFENAVVMMGGNAEAARATVAGLQKSIFDLAYNGQVSDSLVMLTRLGVQFQDASGQARDFNDVILDTADAIQKAQTNGLSRGNAFQFLQQAGFDQGTAQLILSGRGNIQKELAAQEQRYQVTQGALGGAETVRRADIDREQANESRLVKGLEIGAGGPQAFINDLIAHPSTALDKLADAASHAKIALEDMALRSAGVTRGIYNNNFGNLKATGRQRRDDKGFAIFPTKEAGIRANAHQLALYEGRGITTAEGVVNTWAPRSENDVKAYLADVQKITGIKPGEDIRGEEALLLSGMFRHESGKGAPSVDEIADVLTLQDSPQDAAGPTPGVGGGTSYNKTDVHIDNMTITTQARDADEVAGGIEDSLSRKLGAAHFEPGQQ